MLQFGALRLAGFVVSFRRPPVTAARGGAAIPGVAAAAVTTPRQMLRTQIFWLLF
jgi:hypothetical protein